MDFVVVSIIALVVLAVGAMSKPLIHSIVTAPMIFVALGLFLGESGFGLVIPDIKADIGRWVIEVTLVVVLFSEATAVCLHGSIFQHKITLRMLLLGIPLTILFGTVTGTTLFAGVDAWQAALLAAVLAATDLSLGRVALHHEGIPPVIKENLQLESGLNDGLMVPVILFLTVCESLAAGKYFATFWIFIVLEQVGFGILAGITVGVFGASLLNYAHRNGSIGQIFEQLSGTALALLAFSSAEILHGNGLVAAFIAGLVVGNCLDKGCAPIFTFVKAQSELLSLITFLLFGAVILPPILPIVTWQMVAYALLSLTAVRIAAAFISLLGLGLKWQSALFVGWLGPRGIASLLFGMLVLESFNIALRQEIFHAVVITVLISTFLHGISAKPLSHWYHRALGESRQI